MKETKKGISRRQFMKGMAAFAGITAAGALMGCGKKDDGGKTTSSGNEVSGSKYGGVLTIRRSGTTVINPAKSSATQIDKNVYGLFFESLFYTDEEFNVINGLADDYTIAEDGLSIEMHLTEGIKFFNGEDVNAEAVVATWDFYRDPAYQHILLAYANGLDRVEAVDTYKVKFVFTEVNSDFLSVLTTPIGYVLAPGAIEKYKSEGNEEVFAREGGCGPFILTEYYDGERYVTVKNENYYLEDAEGNPLPYLDGVTVQLVSDEAVMAQNMLSGDLDALDYFSSVTQRQVLSSAQNVTLKELTCGYQYFMYMNMTKPPFDNIKVRQAIQYAVDFDEMNEVFCMGAGQDMATAICPTLPYYKEFDCFAYDPAKAKALLKDAGYPDGVTVELYYGTYGIMQQVCELVQAQAKEAGFHIELIGQDGVTVKETWALENENAPAGLRLQNNGTPKVTPSVHLDYIFGADALQNCSKWQNKEFQENLEKLVKTYDEAEKAAILEKLQDLMYEDLPICSLFYTPNFTAYNNKVEGITWDSDTAAYYKAAWINE